MSATAQKTVASTVVFKYGGLTTSRSGWFFPPEALLADSQRSDSGTKMRIKKVSSAGVLDRL